MTPEDVLAVEPKILSQAQREFFFENGYLLLDKAIPDTWVERLRDATDKIVEESRAISESDAKWDLEPGHTGDAPRLRVSVFMSVFNCHINRAPVPGEVVKVAYTPGKFLNASLDKASKDNERNGIVIRMDDGRDLGVVQIAGLVARRILCFSKEGDHLRRGERFGLIRFGSRLDVYLPEGVGTEVSIGQTMIAGETVIARLTQDNA